MDIAAAVSMLGWSGRVLVSEVRRIQGVSAKSGQPYDFVSLGVFDGRGGLELALGRGVQAPPEGAVIEAEVGITQNGKVTLLEWRVASDRGLEAV